MQMTIKQLSYCAAILKEEAETADRLLQDARKQLDEFVHPYEDPSQMTDTDKKTALIYEQRIKRYGEQETAYLALADAIENKNVLVNLGVNL